MGVYTQTQAAKLTSRGQWSENEFCIVLPPEIVWKVVCGIYRIVFNDHFYIGKSVDIVRRASLHACTFRNLVTANKKDKVSQFIRSNPDLYILHLELLEACEPEFLIEREQYYLDKHLKEERCLNTNPKSHKGRTGL